MIEPRQLAGFQVNRSNVTSFEPIADKTSPSQIVFMSFTSVFAGDNMVDFMRISAMLFMNQAVFTAGTGPPSNEIAQCRGDDFAHGC
jgi:hypothetical protein